MIFKWWIHLQPSVQDKQESCLEAFGKVKDKRQERVRKAALGRAQQAFGSISAILCVGTDEPLLLCYQGA